MHFIDEKEKKRKINIKIYIQQFHIPCAILTLQENVQLLRKLFLKIQ
jgi:hypothetical protein